MVAKVIGERKFVSGLQIVVESGPRLLNKVLYVQLFTLLNQRLTESFRSARTYYTHKGCLYINQNFFSSAYLSPDILAGPLICYYMYTPMIYCKLAGA